MSGDIPGCHSVCVCVCGGGMLTPLHAQDSPHNKELSGFKCSPQATVLPWRNLAAESAGYHENSITKSI